MDGDYSKLNRFLGVLCLLGIIVLGFVVAVMANQHDIANWDAEKVKSALVETSDKAKAEVAKFFRRKPTAEDCGKTCGQ